MPDVNPLEAKVPYERPELPDAGLSLIVQPTYDYKNRFPPNSVADNNGSNPAPSSTFDGDYMKSFNQRRKLLGLGPVAPGGEESYNIAKRYNDPTIGFVAGRDNEDIYAQNQGVFSSIGHGVGRLAALTLTKTGTGLGYLAGLVGIGNDSKKYGHDFNAWVAGAGDNGVAKWFDELENDKIKNDWLPIYKKATEKDHGFFRHMGDLDFWTDDITDGAAFIASSFVPGMTVSKLGLGEKVMASLAKLRGLTAATEAEALSAEGVSGAVESANLTKNGLGAEIEQPKLSNTITTPTQEIPKVLGWIDNAKAARAANTGIVSVINTASQAMMSANDAKNSAYDTLINAKNEDGSNKYTSDQALKLSAKVAKDSYLMNLGALSLMNLWEANFLFKKVNASNKFKGINLESTGIFDDATLAKKSFGQRALSSLREPSKGFFTGGLWLGNIQLAIDRLNGNSDNFDLDFGTKLQDLAKQYVKQTRDAFSGNDPDAQKALGIGGVLGGALGKLLGGNEDVEARKNLAALSGQINAFKEIGNIYRTNEDGSLDLQNGSPVIDDHKINSWVASLNKVLNLNQLSRNFEARNLPLLQRVFTNEAFTKFAKAHFDLGMSELLKQKLADVRNMKPEDLALLGYDAGGRSQEELNILSKRLVDKVDDLQKIYDNLHENFISTTIKENTKEGRQKRFDILDKMFYLSSRSQTMGDMIRDSELRYETVKNNIDSYDHTFNSDLDATSTRYNELFEDLEAAKRRQRDIDPEIEREQRIFSELNEPETPELKLPDQFRRTISEKSDAVIAEKQKALDEFITQNKESLNKLKKDARGRYLYEITNKNLLPSAKEIQNQQMIQAELRLANNATLNVVSRLADPVYGERYYDEVYSKELQRQENRENALKQEDEITKTPDKETMNLPKKDNRHFKTNVTEGDIHNALEQGKESKEKIENKTELSEHLAEKIASGKELTEEEQQLKDILGKEVGDKLEERTSKADINDVFNDLSDLRRQRDALEGKEDLSDEEETELQNINKQIDALEQQRDDQYDHFDNQIKVDDSKNIPPEDKEKVLGILNKIGALRKRIKKFDTYYEVDGKRYKKVTDLIGDTISEQMRNDPSVQASVNAGNTIDRLVKAYFGNDLTPEFKESLGSAISQESYDDVIKSLDGIKNDLSKKGIEIVASNAFVIDDDAKVAGEIDLLGIDKDGNFKIYEIQARRPDVYRQYGKRGLGVKIRDLDSKRLSMYRNMFANQYDAVPDEISVKFPFEVKYEKTGGSGFIEDTKLKSPIRFTPVKNVEIKMKAPEPIRIGSKFNSVDMTRIFLDTFLTDKNDIGKLQYIFRNVPFKQLVSGIKLTVGPAGEEFLKRYRKQADVFQGADSDYQIKKFRDFRRKDEFGNPTEFDNLYSLVGDKELSLSYEGQPIGYLSPVQTLAYKDTDGKFQILDENTDGKTYANVTGNDPSTYKEFQRVASAYKKLHTDLTNKLLENGNKHYSLSGDELKDLFDFKISYGELDLLKSKENRPDLKDLKFSGVKMGNKLVPVVVNVDANDSVKVLMDKTRKGKNTFNKYQQVDKWANQNLDKIIAAMTDKSGSRLTDNVGIIETPDGEYKIISLRNKEGFDPSKAEDFVENLGSKFTTSTSKSVFKNEGIMIVPKEPDQNLTIGLKEKKVISEVYKGEDPDSIENVFGLTSAEQSHLNSTIESVQTFLNDAQKNEQLKQDLEDLKLNNIEAIILDFQNGDWSSIEDYLDNLRNC